MFNPFKSRRTVCKILVVEDNPDTQATLQAILQTQEAEIRVVATGEAAENLFKEGYVPNLILLDLNLPKMSGGELMEKTATMPAIAQVPIITFSSTWDEKLDKPYEKDAAVVQQYLDARKVKERAGNLKVSDIIPKYQGKEGVNIVHPQLIVLAARELLHQKFELTPSFQHLIYISKKQVERITQEKKNQ